MRAPILLLGLAATAVAAPVPKELRKNTIVGTWAVTAAVVGVEEQSAYNGQIWKFGADGGLENASYKSGTYAVQSSGVDIVFGPGQTTWRALAEVAGDTLKIAFPKANATRAEDFVPANNNVIYSFKRVRE